MLIVDAIEAAVRVLPDELSADAGYCSEDNLKALEACRICGYIATGRQKHGASAAVGARPAPPGAKSTARAQPWARAPRHRTGCRRPWRRV